MNKKDKQTIYVYRDAIGNLGFVYRSAYVYHKIGEFSTKVKAHKVPKDWDYVKISKYIDLLDLTGATGV